MWYLRRLKSKIIHSYIEYCLTDKIFTNKQVNSTTELNNRESMDLERSWKFLTFCFLFIFFLFLF